MTTWHVKWVLKNGLDLDRKRRMYRGGRAVFPLRQNMSKGQMWESAKEWERKQEKVHFVLGGCIIQVHSEKKNHISYFNRKKSIQRIVN